MFVLSAAVVAGIDSEAAQTESHPDAWARYVPEFNRNDDELYTNAVPNSAAEAFLRENAPSFTCPDKDIERTEHVIIYLDEFDKIARKSGENNSITADPGHEGVQQALLKMLEGSVVEFTARGQRKHPEAPTIKVDTKNILFIVGGAFVGIDKIIAKRLQKSDANIGFGAKVEGEKEKPKFDELIHQVTPDDLMKYGIIPEIIGRLPVICTLETLDEDALLRILTEPKNAPVKQYQKLLAMDNVELEFQEDALRAVARKAIERKTGARSLKGIIEDIMLDVMFDIPKSNEPRKVIITKACIEEGAAPEVVKK